MESSINLKKYILRYIIINLIQKIVFHSKQYSISYFYEKKKYILLYKYDDKKKYKKNT